MILDRFRLDGRTALVTGARRGIGKALAVALAEAGADIVGTSAEMEAAGSAVEREVLACGRRFWGYRCDLAKRAEVYAFIARVKAECPPVDILINNAGTGTSETIMDAPDEKWNHFWDLHVMAAVRLSRALVPLMRKRGGGVILNTASICAKQPLGYEPIYNTTKAALVMFSKCLSNELIRDNIRVNAVNPGLILTPDWKKTAGLLTQGTSTTVDEYLDKIAKDNAPIGRFATPEELAHFYVFLCSPRSSYCVGSSYYVDGGWLKTVE